MQTRRKVLAGVGALSLSSLSGCMGILGSVTGGSDDSEDTGELSTDTDHTIVATDQGISGWVRSISHNPNGQTARITGAIDVQEEREYRVRLGVIDKDGVVLADEITTEDLFPTGTNTVTVELDEVEDCDHCHSGLLQVNYPEEGRTIGAGNSSNDRNSNSSSNSDSDNNSEGGEADGSSEDGEGDSEGDD